MKKLNLSSLAGITKKALKDRFGKMTYTAPTTPQRTRGRRTSYKIPKTPSTGVGVGY